MLAGLFEFFKNFYCLFSFFFCSVSSSTWLEEKSSFIAFDTFLFLLLGRLDSKLHERGNVRILLAKICERRESTLFLRKEEAKKKSERKTYGKTLTGREMRKIKKKCCCAWQPTSAMEAHSDYEFHSQCCRVPLSGEPQLSGERPRSFFFSVLGEYENSNLSFFPTLSRGAQNGEGKNVDFPFFICLIKLWQSRLTACLLLMKSNFQLPKYFHESSQTKRSRFKSRWIGLCLHKRSKNSHTSHATQFSPVWSYLLVANHSLTFV